MKKIYSNQFDEKTIAMASDLYCQYGVDAPFHALACNDYGAELDVYFCLRENDCDITPKMLQKNPDDLIFEEKRKIVACKFDFLSPDNNEQRQNVILHCMNAILFVRWSDTSDYEAYQNSIAHLIHLHGEQNFIAGCKKIFEQHLKSLDLFNVQEQGPHSDITPYPATHIAIFKYILKEKHAMSNMLDYGDLVNVRTLFGDINFWTICKEYHPEVYNNLVATIARWPKSMHNTHGYHRFDSCIVEIFSPYVVFKREFTEANQFIEKDLLAILEGQGQLEDFKESLSLSESPNICMPSKCDTKAVFLRNLQRTNFQQKFCSELMACCSFKQDGSEVSIRYVAPALGNLSMIDMFFNGRSADIEEQYPKQKISDNAQELKASEEGTSKLF